MLDWKSQETLGSIRKIIDVLQGKQKPIVFWIGAGISKWCGYPLWDELAQSLHQQFSRYKAQGYDNTKARFLINSDLPGYFEYCKEISPTDYRSRINEAFQFKPQLPVYERFLNVLAESTQPLRIISTNVDELLERNLNVPSVVQRTDMERLYSLVPSQESFIAKIHGSISSIDSLVFTSEEYRALIEDKGYVNAITSALSSSSIIFFGYSIRDQYLLNILQENHKGRPLFGDGPHFAVLPSKRDDLPPSVSQIIYSPDMHKDHRSAIRVLESAKYLGASKISYQSKLASLSRDNMRSVHFITDIAPPGTWTSSQTVEFGDVDGAGVSTLRGYFGHGINASELPNLNSTAMHDFVIGMLCFDQVFMPLNSAHRVHQMVGSEIYWNLVKSDILKFIHWEGDEGVVFKKDEVMALGGIGTFSNVTVPTAGDVIRKQLRATPGKESEAEKLFEVMNESTITIANADLPSVTDVVRGLLVYPDIRKSLAIGDGVSCKDIPEWLVFPVLRLAQVVRVGLTCNHLDIPSTKLIFGLSGLAGPVFSACSYGLWIDQVASYVLAGNFSAHLGAAFLDDPQLIIAIMKFRESAEGESFRKEILSHIHENNAGEVGAAVNGGLRSCIDVSVLDRAKQRFSGIMVAEKPIGVAALWNNNDYDREAMSRWRTRSKSLFEEYCAKHDVKSYDPCPCGSGEKTKFCCAVV